MLVSGIQIVDREDYCELQAQVKCDTHWIWGDDPFPLWYRFPREYRAFLSTENGDPFIAAFLAPAMALGEPLKIEASVSAKLLSTVPEIQTIYQCWDKELSEIAVEAPIREQDSSDADQPSNIGLFFSMGVDSSYSLLKNIRSHPDDDETITHLINVLGFDIYLWEIARYPAVLTNINRVAKELGRTALPITTNLREFSDRIADFVVLYHGPALASVALALGRMFKRAHIAAGQTYTSLIPRGSHPLLDPLWATEHLSFVHDGLEANKLDKIRLVSQSPILLETLRVCATDHTNDVYNCGRCTKCLRTMIALHIAGSLQNCKTLPHDIDLELLRSLSVSSPLYRQQFQTYIAALGTSKADLAIKAALEECLSKNRASEHGLDVD